MAGERTGIRFLLGFEDRSLAAIDPTMTVLEWLRGEARLCGTKEGCAEGDCGACTVVLAEPDGDRLRYRAINACILFVPQLDGKQLICVEHLAGPEGRLHPVQQAMVDHHASQCGFCTPGFVMSLVAACHGTPLTDRAAVDTTLAGNLCRCTGYRPIADAAMAACANPAPDHFTAREAETLARLHVIAPTDTLALRHEGRAFFAPSTIDGLATVLAAQPDATILAGGTDVGLWVTKLHRDMDCLVAIGAVADMQRIEMKDSWLRIGAGATYTDAIAALGALHPTLGELVRRIGSVQVRNGGTIGGNVANASPIGDTPPALIALAAELVLRQGATQRRLPIEDFFQGYRKTALRPGEFLERIDIPPQPPGALFLTHKVSKRPDQDISAVCGAFRITLADGIVTEARLAFGGMAATPARAKHAEAALRGKPWQESTIRAAMTALDGDFTPLSDMRASAAYRAAVARNLLLRLFHHQEGERAA